jgi:histidyl-tRNA synthetase
MIEYLCPECRAHFESLRAYLDALGIAYVVNPRIVRGLDYYTRTVFEFVSSVIGSQSTVCGGGRYDGLVEELGGPPTPGVGFGLGVERFLMVVEKLAGDHAPPRRGVQAIALGEAARERLVPLVGALREASAEPTFADWQNRKLTAHFKTADRNNARWALILGDDELASGEIVLRDLVARSDRRLPMAGPAAEVARLLVEATG